MRTRLCRCYSTLGFLSFLLTAAALIIGLSAVPAAAQTTCPGATGTCIQDEFDCFNANTKTLSCTASDVKVATVVDELNLDGTQFKSCFENVPFSFIAEFEIKTTSTKTRSNVGIFFNRDTTASSALTGTCDQFILSPAHNCPGSTSTPPAQCGSIGSPTHYEELDQSINGEKPPAMPGGPAGCGDTTSADSTTLFGPSTQDARLELDGISCKNFQPCPAGTFNPNHLATCIPLQVCTSWSEPDKGLPVCTSPGPSYPWQIQAVPGTTSKCNCSTLFIPAQPVMPSASVVKSCTTAKTAMNTTSCDEGAGDVAANTVTYTITIKNTTPAGQGGIIIDQICDSLYGQIFPTTGGTCPAGTIGNNGSLISTTCSSSMPGDIGNGSSGSCTFTAHQNENLKEMDTVNVQGHSDLSAAATFGDVTKGTVGSNTVTVTSEDSPTTSSTTKGLANPPATAACITARYNVQVNNTSGADETIHLSALTDSVYNDITTLHSNSATFPAGTPGYIAVVGTTCGIATTSNGLGTLSGSAGAGALPASIAPAGNYPCQFDGEFCAAVAAGAEEFNTGVCDTVVGSLTFDKCTNPGATNGHSCTTNAQCDLTCTGISQTDTVTGTITGDETSAPLDVVSQTITGLNLTECVQAFTSPH